MKFLCVSCDEQMMLERTLAPENDAISAVFACPKCGSAFAMHTNSMETQLVRSLDIKIGKGGAEERMPMQSVRASLAGVKDLDGHVSAAAQSDSPSGGSKCPFSDVVTEAFEAEVATGPVWTSAANERLDRVPSFIRPMVKRGIEDMARQKGYAEITEEVMQEVRGEIGM